MIKDFKPLPKKTFKNENQPRFERIEINLSKKDNDNIEKIMIMVESRIKKLYTHYRAHDSDEETRQIWDREIEGICGNLSHRIRKLFVGVKWR